MHILYLEWASYANEHIKRALLNRGHKLTVIPFPTSEDCRYNAPLCESIVKSLFRTGAECCFSINYYPIVAIACKACNKKYISWTYDSPYIFLYSDTIFYETNYAFVFDRYEVEQLRAHGVTNVFHLPLAVPTMGYSTITAKSDNRHRFASDISMIGSTYSEKKHRFLDKLDGIDSYTQGYIEGLINAQKYLYGIDIITDSLNNEIVDNLNKIAPILKPEDEFESRAWVYSKYFIAREITRRERFDILKMLGEAHSVTLFTNEDTPELPMLLRFGPLDYLSEAPIAMHNSKINLNITLRSIVTGIPLRCFDIMGARGFLMTNYQEELLDLFIPDEDFVFYASPDELSDKVDFYLCHDDIRQKIANNGFQKAITYNTYETRIQEIEKIAKI